VASVRSADFVQAQDQPASNTELNGTVHQFFALSDQRMRWTFNDPARRLDHQTAVVAFCEVLVPAPARSAWGLSLDGRSILRAISELPGEEREVFDLERVLEMAQTKAVQVLGASAATEERRLNRGLRLAAEQLADLRPSEPPLDLI
jgi:DNA-directed RNA polymerase specialized sigma24 family protein